jgi:hypothetical protein
MSLWDIFKSAFVVFLAVVIWVKMDGWVNSMASKSSGITESTITRIASNMIMQQNIASKAEFNKFKKEISERQSRYASDTDTKIKSALNTALEYNKKTGAQLTALGETVSQMNTSFKETIGKFYKDPTTDKPSTRDYEDYDLERKMSDGSILPEGWVKYHPNWKGPDKLVQYHYPLKYYTTIVRSQHEDGAYAYNVEAWVENDFVKKSKGIKYPLKLQSVHFEEIPLKDKKWRWNPRLGLGAGITSKALFPSLDISAFSYGLTKVDMDWRFLTLGVGYAGLGNTDTKFIGSFTPVQYNLGKVLPFVENLFLGPGVSVDTDSDIGYGGIISVPF